MSVTLSLFAGVGAQFLDNNGSILSGGLIYTYNAGTTTPAATYTTNLGNVAQPNPIVLDSSGRIPTGELWLSNGVGYKFVVKDANNVLIGTYDNVPSSAQPPITNDASSIYYELGTTVNAGSFVTGQTYFITYVGTTNFQLIGASANQTGVYFIATGAGTGSGTAQISRTVQAALQSMPSLADFDSQAHFDTYSNALTNPVNFAIKPQSTIRTLISKLDDFVSVLDFGADSTGVTDSSTAFQNAVNTGKAIYVPKGTYKCGFTLGYGQRIFGEGARDETTLTPTGNNATVILISATSVAKQHCTIENLGILNPNNYTGCNGISFQGTNVATINDNHYLANLYIYGLQYGVYVTGRLILSTFINVEITNCTTAMYVNTDATTPAFNGNCFITCRFVNSIQNGFYFTGQNLSNTFLNCDFESNNSANANSYGGIYITGTTQDISFLGCYWENNGVSVAIDTGTIGNNSFGLYITGTLAINVLLQECYMVTSGIMFYNNVTTGVIGGLVTGCRFAPTTNGWDIYQSSKLGGAYQPFVIDGNNYFSGKMEVTENANGDTPACIRQLTGLRYITGTVSGVDNIDLRRTQNVFCQTSGTITFNSTNTLYFVAGERFTVVNNGSGSTVIDASIMASGASVTLTSGQTANFIVANSIGSNKFIKL